MKRHPTVVVITTGGTIASRIDPATGSVIPSLSGEDLVQAVPGLSDVANVEVQAYANVPGPGCRRTTCSPSRSRPRRRSGGPRWRASSSPPELA